MKSRMLLKMVIVIGMVICSLGSAWAKDNVQAEVTSTTPDALVTPNGMAVGTIHVVFTVNAFELTPGEFGSFDLDLAILKNVNNPTNSYPLSLALTQKQQGDDILILKPNYDSLYVTNSAWVASRTITVTIPEDAPSDDGTTLTGVLQIEGEGNANSKIGTVTTVVVKVVLLHPTACLKITNFVTGEDFSSLDEVVVNLKTDKKDGSISVNSTNPGQLSDNILVVNNCSEDQVIDLKILLDGCFDTNPSGNPGNAVFTYMTAGEVDQESFDISAFGDGTAQGQNLCLSGLTIPTGQTLLTTVHMGVDKDTPGAYFLENSSFVFSAEALDAGSDCNGYPHAMTDYTPAATSVPFTTK